MHRNDNAKPCEPHDWEPSTVEAMVDVCAWCRETRPASPAPVVGVDVPGPVVEAVVFARAA